MKIITLTAVCFFLISFVGCSLFSQRAKAREAIEALQKIRAATQIGVSRFEYKRLLIEAKPKVESAKLRLSDRTLKSKLDTAMFYYEEAGHSWDDYGEFAKGSMKDDWDTANKALSEIE